MSTPPGDEYIAAMRALPAPTRQQIENFAGFVAEAHSWYKHLLIGTDVPFHFYLNPQAGRESTYDPESGWRFQDRDPATRFHYTWMPTPTYRERFGYLHYLTNAGPTFFFGGASGFTATVNAYEGPSVWVEPPGKAVMVPESVFEAGSVPVTALVHPFGPVHLRYVEGEPLELQLLGEEITPPGFCEELAELISVYAEKPMDEEYAERFHAVLEKENRRQRQDMVDAIERMLGLVYGT